MSTKGLREALDALYVDNHRWSTRPCLTCDAISKATGIPFGCDKMAGREYSYRPKALAASLSEAPSQPPTDEWTHKELIGVLKKTVLILCETRGHHGRRPCEFCCGMHLWKLFQSQDSEDRSPAPLRELKPLDGGNWYYDHVRDIVMIEGRKFVPAPPIDEQQRSMKMSFTAQTKEGPKNQVHMNVTEIERLLEFAKASHKNGNAFVTITGSETGIGMYVEVSDSTGAVVDISDYASW